MVTTLSIAIEPDLTSKIAKYADEHHMSVSAVVRKFCREGLLKHEQKELENRGTR